MSRITFRVNSIELKDSTLHHVSHHDLLRINITQRPTKEKQEYLLHDINSLSIIDHEFVIDDREKKVNRITMTLRTVIRSSYVNSLYDYNNPARGLVKEKPKDKSIDRYIASGCKENRDEKIDCVYVEPKHSLIGYCTVKLNELEPGINNALRLELRTRTDEQVVGYVNLEVYIYKYPVITAEQKAKTNEAPIFFQDPGCPTENTQPVTF